MALERAGLQAVLEGVGPYLANAKKIESGNSSLDRSLRSVSHTGQALGNILGTALKLGVGALATTMGAAVFAASGYQQAMSLIRGLTETTAEDTDRLSEAVLNLSKQLGKSPTELGAAAYFILSSGIKDVDEAMKVLEISAKASTAGLGETKVIADLLTSLMNAYGKENLSAARAADILIETIKQGKGEPDEFAGALGRVITVASTMGVTFEEVGASLAVMTNVGISANEAVTGLRGILSQILSPSDKAKKTLAGIGLTFVDLRKNIKERGLLDTLGLLKEAFQDDEEALSDLFPDIRGFVGFLSTAGRQSEAYADALNKITNRTGQLDQAFEESRKNLQFWVNVLKSQVTVRLIQLGDKLLPSVMRAVIFLGQAFDRAAGGIGKAAQALGPLLHLFGVGLSGGKIGGDFSVMEQAAYDFGKALGSAADEAARLWDKIGELTHLFQVGFSGGKIGGEFSDLEIAMYDAGRAARDLKLALDELAGFAGDVGRQITYLVDGLGKANEKSNLLTLALRGVETIFEGIILAAGLLGKGLSAVAKFLNENQLAAKIATGVLAALLAVILAAPLAFAGFLVALGWLRDNLDRLAATASRVFSDVSSTIGTFVRFIWNQVPTIQLVWDTVLLIFEAFRGATSVIWALVHGDFTKAWEAIKEAAGRIAQAIWQTIVDIFSGLPTALFNLGKQAGEALLKGLASIPGVKTAIDAIKGIGGAIGKVAGALGMQEGGLVTRPTIAMLGEGSHTEAVLPLTNVPRARQIWASIPPSVQSQIAGGPTFSSVFNVSGMTIDQQEAMTLAAVRRYFTQVRGQALRSGAMLSLGVS